MKNIPVLTLGSRVVVDEVPCIVTAYQPFKGLIELRPSASTGTEDLFWMSLPELAARSVRTAPIEPPPNMFSDGPWPDVVRDMAGHVEEVLTGIGRNGRKLRKYSLELSLNDRIAAKLQEMEELGTPTSLSTLKRRIQDYRRAGIAGVADGMQRRKGPRPPVVDPRVEEAIVAVVSDRTYMSTTSMRVIVQDVQRELVRRFGAEGEALARASERSFRRWIAPYTDQAYTFGNARLRATTANKPDRAYTRVTALLPGELTEIDSTPVDVEILDDDGQPYRPHLTVLLDVATRCLVSWSFTAEASSGYDHALLLANAAVPIPLRPGHEHLSLRAAQLEEQELFGAVDPKRLGSYRIPFIFPTCITMDGGADFRGSVFESACHYFGVDLNYAAPRTPTHKGHVERFFRTFEDTFCKYLAGHTGTDVAQRGRLTEALWNLEDLEAAFIVWYTTVYLDSPHQGLRDPFHPATVWTPRQAYAARLNVGEGVAIPLTTEDYFHFMPKVERKLGPNGIQFNNRNYDSKELQDFRARSLGQTKWEVRYHPLLATSVWVHDQRQDRWIEARDKNLALVRNSGLTLEFSQQLMAGEQMDSEADSLRRREGFAKFVKAEEKARRHGRVKQQIRQTPQAPVPTVPIVPDFITSEPLDITPAVLPDAAVD